MRQNSNIKYAIEVENLRREYEITTGWVKKKKQTVVACNNINFKVRKGEIFGLLGENGAGKTTTIKMLITLLAPTSGKCYVCGKDCFSEAREIRPHINFIFGGEMGMYKRLSAKDNLLYFASLYKITGNEAKQKADELLEKVGLKKNENQLVETFSKGMVQRLQIARGLLNDPEIIFMDEPTIGLDPLGANMLRNLIRQIRAEGKTVLLTTHYMQEADDLCDEIAIMNHGQIVAMDTPEQLKIKYGSKGADSKFEDVFLSLIESEA